MSDDFKPGTRPLLRLAGLDAQRAFVSRDDETLVLWTAVVALMVRLHLEPDPEQRRETGAADAQVLHVLRAALAENFGIEAADYLSWALVVYGCRQKPTLASLQPWEKLMFEWQQRRASAPRIALLLRDGGLDMPLKPAALEAVDGWIAKPASALGEASAIVATLFGDHMVSFDLHDGGGTPAHDGLFRVLVGSVAAAPPLVLTRQRLEPGPDGARWIVEYTAAGVERSFETRTGAAILDVENVMAGVDALLADLGRPERAFRLLPGRARNGEIGIFVIADGARFAEIAWRLRLPLLPALKFADLPLAVPTQDDETVRSALDVTAAMVPTPASAPAPLFAATAPTPPHAAVPRPAVRPPTSSMSASASASASATATASASAPPGPPSQLPSLHAPSALDSGFASVPPPGLEPDASMRTLLTSLRRSFGTGRMLHASRSVRQSHVSAPAWLAAHADPVRVLYEKQDVLLRKGRIVWGALVEADGALFEAGEDDRPGLLVYSLDAYFDARPAELAALGVRLAGLKATPGTSATSEPRRLGQQIRNDSGRPLDVPLPTALSARAVLLTSFMGVRAHLPDGILGADWFPLLAHPSSVIPMIVPCMFWPPALRAAWGMRRLRAEPDATPRKP